MNLLNNEGIAERHPGNQRAASTIILLSVLTVVAIVFVHKESTVGDTAEAVVTAPLPEGATEWNEHSEMELFQSNKAAHKSTLHRRHRAVGLPAKAAKQQGKSLLLLQEDGSTEAIPSLHNKEVDPNKTDPDPVQTVPQPYHADLDTAKVSPYGDEGYDAKAVAEARASATKELNAGGNVDAALRKAQETATNSVVLDSVKNAEAPAFSRTIQAAAFKAEQTALHEMQHGANATAVKRAASKAAADVVADQRSVETSVPVSNSLKRQLVAVKHLWEQMEKKVGQLHTTIAGMPKENCPDEVATAESASKEMSLAVIHASRHIARGHAHRVQMETHLLQAQAHESHSRMLLQKPTSPGELMLKRKLEVNTLLAADNKEEGARHHMHAQRHAHLAEGFLALASKHETTASQAHLQCQATDIVQKFEFTQAQAKKYELSKAAALKKAAAAKKATKKLAEEKLKEKLRDEKLAKAKRLAAEKLPPKPPPKPPTAAEKKATQLKAAQHIRSTILKKSVADIADRQTAIKTLVVAMQTSLPVQMRLAARQAAAGAKGQHLATAATAACHRVIKRAAKELAHKMAKVASAAGESPTALMKQAIVLVLKEGRPIQASIVHATVAQTLAATSPPEVHTQQEKARPQLVVADLKQAVVQAKASVRTKQHIQAAKAAVARKEIRLATQNPRTNDQRLTAAVAKATAQAARAAQKKVAAAGGSMADQLKAAQMAARVASKLAAKAFASKLKKESMGTALGLLQKTAQQALQRLQTTDRTAGEVKMHAAVKKALRPVLAAGITKAVSMAVVAARKQASTKQLSATATQAHMVKVARKAATEAKKEGYALAKKVERAAVQEVLA